MLTLVDESDGADSFVLEHRWFPARIVKLFADDGWVHDDVILYKSKGFGAAAY